MRNFVIVCMLAFLNVCLFGQKLKNGSDSTSYCLGLSIAKGLSGAGFKNLNLAILNRAMKDFYAKKETVIKLEKTDSIINYYLNKETEKMAKENLVKANKFLEENKTKEGIIVLPSGLQYKVITQGEGEKPKETDNVLCHYKGTLIDGKVFDSSYDRGEPVSFQLNRVIKGWVEGLQLMNVGSKYILYLPPDLGYGEKGAGEEIGPNEVLIFEVELLGINQ